MWYICRVYPSSLTQCNPLRKAPPPVIGNGRRCRKLGPPMIKFISRLPLRAFYAFSSFLYLLAFYVVRHRHQVIREQIEKVFPDSSPAAREAIHKQFLRNFCDVLVEVWKSVSMTSADMCSRVHIVNLEVPRRFLDAGQSPRCS